MATISGIQSHVHRVINRAGGFFDSGPWAGRPLLYVDLERIDFFYLETGNGPDFQKYGVTLKWMDEGRLDGTSANPARAMSMVRLTLGAGSPYDDVAYVDFPIVDFLARVEDGQATGASFFNDPATPFPYRVWTSDLQDNPYGRVSSGYCSDAGIEARLNAGENIPSIEYGASIKANGQMFISVDYLLFYITRQDDGQMIGNLMPVTDLVKSLDHSGAG